MDGIVYNVVVVLVYFFLYVLLFVITAFHSPLTRLCLSTQQSLHSVFNVFEKPTMMIRETLMAF